MQYADVKAAFLDAPAGSNPVPAVVANAGPARRLRDAFEPLSMHAVWSPLVHERMASHGLDFFGTYIWGRACVLGEPTGAVVASAFAAFEPGMIAGVYDQARAAVSHQVALRTTFESAAESMANVLIDSDRDHVAGVADRLASIVDGLDRTGRPLFAGAASVDWSEDPFGRLWHACLALREHRGDGHVAAYVSEGFSPVEMNILTELWLDYSLGDYSGTRAWPDAATEAAIDSLDQRGLMHGVDLTELGRSTRDAIEARTDAGEASVIAALGDDLDQTIDDLARWSQACLDVRTFPSDPRKRAAG